LITDLTNPFEALHSNFGFSLIPIQPGTKMPGLDSWAKFQDEQCQINDLRRWIRNFSAFAVITGPVSGVVVVDLDGPDALAWAEENLTPTPWIVLTGAKGEFRGQHWYYLWPDDLADGVSVRNRGRVKHNGKKLELDIRGEGGYVLAPGSPHMDGGFYEATRVWTHADDVPTFNPSWFPEEARPAALPRTLSRDAQKMEQRFIRWLERKEFPAKGQRNHETHQAACSGYDFGLSHDTVLQHVMAWNDMSPDPLPWKEVQTTVRSAEKSKQAPRYPKGEIEDRETFFERMKAERQASMTREEANRQEVLEALVKSTKSYAESGVKAQPQEQLDLAQETEDDYYDAHPIGDDPTDMDEDSVPDASPEGMDARIYTERNFISQSFDNHAISMVLASFSDEDWKDHASKYVARAIKRTAEGHDVKDKEGFTRTIVSNACKEDNSWAEWQTILDFWGATSKTPSHRPAQLTRPCEMPATGT
jgi:hypothetical protein